jgi:hypothetical protein
LCSTEHSYLNNGTSFSTIASNVRGATQGGAFSRTGLQGRRGEWASGGPLRCLPSWEGGKGQSEESIFESMRLRSAVQDDAATETRPQRRPALAQPLQVARVHAVSGLDLHAHHHSAQFDQDIHLAAVVRAPADS